MLLWGSEGIRALGTQRGGDIDIHLWRGVIYNLSPWVPIRAKKHNLCDIIV